jgi:hypothetical protein
VTSISRLLALLIVAAVSIGCSISSHDSEEKKGSKVDIDSPVASLHVQTNEQAKHDTGISVYPGARPAPPDEHDNTSSANVSLGFAGFGLKVVAAKYLTDDSPEKVLDFYRKEMTKFGKVVECKGDFDIHSGKENKTDCSPDPQHPDKTELGVNDKSGSHVVSVKPKSKGTEFGLIFLQMRDKERETM